MNPPEQNSTSVPWLLRFAAKRSRGIDLCLKQGPASGPMMAYASRNQPSGNGAIGRWIDRRFLNYSGWEAVRQRRRSLEQLIKQAINSISPNRSGQSLQILDIAGGSADYLVSALIQIKTTPISALCLDNSSQSIAYGRDLAQRSGLSHIQYQLADANNPVAIKQLCPHPDIVICSGFYELISDDQSVAASIKTISDLLPNNGRFIVSQQTALPTRPVYAKLFRNVDGSAMTLTMRPKSAIATLLLANGFVVEEITSAADLYAIFLARRIREE